MRWNRNTRLFHEHQIDGTNDEEEGQNMVPMQMSALEHDVGNNTEYSQRDALLNDLQLDEVKRTTVLDKAKTVGRYLTAVFKEGDAPRENDNADEGPVAAGARFL